MALFSPLLKTYVFKQEDFRQIGGGIGVGIGEILGVFYASSLSRSFKKVDSAKVVFDVARLPW